MRCYDEELNKLGWQCLLCSGDGQSFHMGGGGSQRDFIEELSIELNPAPGIWEADGGCNQQHEPFIN